MRRLEIRPLAESDVTRAFRWYEGQAAGLGHEFLRALDVAYAAIERAPEAYAVVYKTLRRALLRRFPYKVYFVVGAEVIEVVAVVHERRHPSRWKARA